jgi:hypothetical protein
MSQEMSQGGEDVRAETASRGIGFRKSVPFEKTNKEALRKILGVVQLVPVPADVIENRLPIDFAERA